MMLNGKEFMDTENRDQLIALIKECPLFSRFMDQDIAYLLPWFRPKKILKDEILIHQGDVSDNIFIVVSGVLVSLLSYGLETQKIIGTINASETIGELGVISGEPRSLTVKALVDAELLQLPGEVFLQLCLNHPDISMHIMKLITSRLQKTIALISDKNPYNILVFFLAHKNIDFNNFSKNIEKHFEKYPVEFLSTEIKDPQEILRNLHNHLHPDSCVAIFVENYDAELFDFLTENSAKFYCIVDGDTTAHVDDVGQLILSRIQAQINPKLELILLQHNRNILADKTKSWLAIAKFVFHHHIAFNDDLTYQRFLRFALSYAVGLVLGGGGMRGFAHLGVLKALREKKIPIDIIGGTSVGAALAACYAVTENYAQCFKLFKKILMTAQQAIYLRNLTWPITSIFSGNPITSFVLEEFGDTQIEDLWLPFFCVSSNISTNSEMVHKIGSLGVALRCSGAVPVLSPPMVIDGQQYYDGGLLNNLPVDVMRQFIGSKNKIIACDVSRYAKDPTVYDFPPVVSLRESLMHVLKLSPKRYTFPRFFENFFHTMLLGASSKTEMNGMVADVLIRPDLSEFATFKSNEHNMELLIEIGYQQAIAAIERLKFIPH